MLLANEIINKLNFRLTIIWPYWPLKNWKRVQTSIQISTTIIIYSENVSTLKINSYKWGNLLQVESINSNIACDYIKGINYTESTIF